jgi:hypothetical protein
VKTGMRITAAAATIVAGMTGVSSANQISVKLFATGDSGIDGSGAAGVVRQTGNWNNLSAPAVATTASYSSLVDNTGFNYGSGAGAPSIAIVDGYFSTGPGAGNFTGGTTEDGELFTGSIGANTSSANTTDTITLSNVPYSSYNIYVYFGGSSASTWEAQDSDTGVNYYLKGDYVTSAGYSLGTATTSGSATPANYVIFSESSPNDVLSFPVTGAANGALNLAVFGIQIVQTPEPASAGVIAVAGSVGLLRRRRRSRTS